MRSNSAIREYLRYKYSYFDWEYIGVAVFVALVLVLSSMALVGRERLKRAEAALWSVPGPMCVYPL